MCYRSRDSLYHMSRCAVLPATWFRLSHFKNCSSSILNYEVDTEGCSSRFEASGGWDYGERMGAKNGAKLKKIWKNN